MKNTIIKKNTVVAFIISCFMLYGNVYAQQGFNFAAKLGLNLSNAAVDPEETNLEVSKLNTFPLPGYIYGMAFTYGFNDHLGVQTGIELVLKKYNLNFENPDIIIRKSTDSYSWNIPFLFTHRSKIYQDRRKKYKKVYLKKHTGISMAMMNSTEKNIHFINNDEFSYKYKINVPRTIDYILDVGISIEIDSDARKGHNIANFGVSYHHGFSDIMNNQLHFTNNNVSEQAGITGRNRYISIDVTLFYPH